MNLIINASEALGGNIGDIVVSIGFVDADRAYLSETFLDEHLPEGRYVYLEVTDTGSGMDKVELVGSASNAFFKSLDHANTERRRSEGLRDGKIRDVRLRF